MVKIDFVAGEIFISVTSFQKNMNQAILSRLIDFLFRHHISLSSFNALFSSIR